MIETASVALATLFTTVGPFDVAAVFAALTGLKQPLRNAMPMRYGGS